MGFYEFIIEHLTTLKALMVVWLGWGFGYAAAIVFVLLMEGKILWFHYKDKQHDKKNGDKKTRHYD